MCRTLPPAIRFSASPLGKTGARTLKFCGKVKFSPPELTLTIGTIRIWAPYKRLWMPPRGLHVKPMARGRVKISPSNPAYIQIFQAPTFCSFTKSGAQRNNFAHICLHEICLTVVLVIGANQALTDGSR